LSIVVGGFGQPLPFVISLDTTAGELKRLIEERTGVEPQLQTLRFQDRDLLDDQGIYAQGVRRNSTLSLSVPRSAELDDAEELYNSLSDPITRELFVDPVVASSA